MNTFAANRRKGVRLSSLPNSTVGIHSPFQSSRMATTRSMSAFYGQVDSETEGLDFHDESIHEMAESLQDEHMTDVEDDSFVSSAAPSVPRFGNSTSAPAIPRKSSKRIRMQFGQSSEAGESSQPSAISNVNLRPISRPELAGTNGSPARKKLRGTSVVERIVSGVFNQSLSADDSILSDNEMRVNERTNLRLSKPNRFFNGERAIRRKHPKSGAESDLWEDESNGDIGFTEEFLSSSPVGSSTPRLSRRGVETFGDEAGVERHRLESLARLEGRSSREYIETTATNWRQQTATTSVAEKKNKSPPRAALDFLSLALRLTGALRK